MARMVHILLLACCFAVAASKHVKEPELPAGWMPLKDHSSIKYDTVELTFMCKERNMDRVEQIALEVSDPRSPRYGKHLSQVELDEMTAPLAEDVKAVKEWLERFGGQVTVTRNRALSVALPVRRAERMLHTRFKHLKHSVTGQSLLRASHYKLPGAIAERVSAVFGLHGLPLPPHKPASSTANADAAGSVGIPMPPKVTPSVIASQYGIGGVSVSGSSANRQAVAEFQGQKMLQSDLTTFFKEYVPGAKAGDDTVYKFVGNNGTGSDGGEASLDIQYIMGVAPGIKTEFWEFSGNHFCQDLVTWTDTLLSQAVPPLVNSVSYGIQANLTAPQGFCQVSDVAVVDGKFAQLAARGVSIIFASGDSGSGESTGACSPKAGVRLEGTVEQSAVYASFFGPNECCTMAQGKQFTYTKQALPSAAPLPVTTCAKPAQGVALSGMALPMSGVASAADCCTRAQQDGLLAYTYDSATSTCLVFFGVSGKASAPSTTSSAMLKLQAGCTVFSEVSASVPASGNFTSQLSVGTATLWPSWPASSPWVTAVGATAFITQQPVPGVVEQEMAVNQFGSGGGFSWTIPRLANATWQEEDVSAYLAAVDKTAAPFPVPSAYNPAGRATPDVSAFGEGFQVVLKGQVQSIGGTSAATPTFAAIVSLLNEARLAKGKAALGFLNPFLYAHGSEAFTDITVGTNAISRQGGPFRYGYNATKGWDPATGLGTPKFQALLKAALASP